MIQGSVGVDLAGSPKRNTGIAYVDDSFEIDHAIVISDYEIVEYVLNKRPSLVVIDAPLFLPKGRRSLDTRQDIHLRECDRELIRRKIRFFPVTLGPMRMLTKRGILLASILREKGFRVFEGYPGASQDILGVPRKKKGVQALAKGLRELGLNAGEWSHDELDALTVAYVGWLHLHGKTELIGDPSEGLMVLPRPDSR
ncbi:MAG: DUF429 domain-containing protein [Thermoprotei archaeon]